MKKLFIGMPSIFLAASLFSGCYPTGEQSFESIGMDGINEIISDNEHLSITEDLSGNYPSSVPKINVEVMQWDNEKISELFLVGRDDIKHYEYPSDYFENKNYDAYMYDSEENNDGYWLVYEAGRLTSEIRADYNTLGYGTIVSSLRTTDFGAFFNDETASFPKEDAKKRAGELLSVLGLNNLSEPYVYAISKEKANEYIDDYNENKLFEGETGYQHWTADDEIYVLSYPLEFENIPAAMNFHLFSASQDVGFYDGTRIDLIVTKNEVLSIKGEDLFSQNFTAGDEIEIKCSAENALKIAAEHYNNTVLPGIDMDITDCKLVYVPFEQTDELHFDLIPMWEIDVTINYDNSDLLSPRDFLYINAETGNIMV